MIVFFCFFCPKAFPETDIDTGVEVALHYFAAFQSLTGRPQTISKSVFQYLLLFRFFMEIYDAMNILLYEKLDDVDENENNERIECMV